MPSRPARTARSSSRSSKRSEPSAAPAGPRDAAPDAAAVAVGELGSGTSVAEVNRLIKNFEQTRKLMKKLGSAPQMMRGMNLPGMFR